MNIAFCFVNYVYGQTAHVCPYKGFGFVILHECECNWYNNNNNNFILCTKIKELDSLPCKWLES